MSEFVSVLYWSTSSSLRGFGWVFLNAMSCTNWVLLGVQRRLTKFRGKGNDSLSHPSCHQMPSTLKYDILRSKDTILRLQFEGTTFPGPGQHIRAYVAAAMQGPEGLVVTCVDTAYFQSASLLTNNCHDMPMHTYLKLRKSWIGFTDRRPNRTKSTARRWCTRNGTSGGLLRWGVLQTIETCMWILVICSDCSHHLESFGFGPVFMIQGRNSKENITDCWDCNVVQGVSTIFGSTYFDQLRHGSTPTSHSIAQSPS